MSKADIEALHAYVIITESHVVSVVEAETVKKALDIYFITISTDGLRKGFSIYPISFWRFKES